jgi:hypothetical protein
MGNWLEKNIYLAVSHLKMTTSSDLSRAGTRDTSQFEATVEDRGQTLRCSFHSTEKRRIENSRWRFISIFSI